ncbi:MAG TPA: gluconokinase [Ktedonobacteraceae bacterium]|jgi:gluconokinase
MATQPLLLALDIGTSSVRALLYDAHGNALPTLQAQQRYRLSTSHAGEASVDADMLVDLVACTIDEVLARTGARASEIIAVATAAFWHTLLPLDTHGRPLLPLMTWEDRRPQQQCLALRQQLDEAAIHRRTGARLHTSYWPAKLCWLAETYPRVAQQTARYVSFSEYLHTCFLGRAQCSLSMASGTGLLNIRERTWDRDLLTALHLSAGRLPEIGDLPASGQGLQPAFARRWPALAHLPWFPAIGDGAAASVGSHCLTPARWAVTIGTSSALRVVVAPARVEPTHGLWLYCVDARRALLGGALSEGGNMAAWLEKTLSLPALAELDRKLAQMEPAAHGLTILPMLAGERSPGWHPDASMTITGLSLHSTPIDIAQAALEAVVFQISRVYDQLAAALPGQSPRLIVSGAALLKSALLRQALADTLNRPLDLLASSEASARGAALLALETLGIIPDLAQLTPSITSTVQPDPARHAIYQQARQRQQALYERLLSTQTFTSGLEAQ